MFFKRMISPADSCISGHANLHLRSLGQYLLKKYEPKDGLLK